MLDRQTGENGGAAYFFILPLRFNEVRTKF